MKVKSSVLLGLIVLVCLLGGLSLMSRLNVEEDMWRPVDMYSAVGGTHGSTFSTVSYDGAASSGVDMPMMPQSGSAFRRRAVSSYAHTGASTNPSSIANGSSPIANSQGLYATSSAEHRSFGGGGNAAVSMSGGVVKSATSPVASTVTGVSTSGSVLSVGNLAQSSSSFNGDMLSSMYASSGINTPYPAYAGIGNTTQGIRGINGSHKAPGYNDDTWLNWFAENGENYAHKDEEGVWRMDIYDLAKAYEDFCNSWNETMGGTMPTWDEWLSWFMGSEDDPFVWNDGEEDLYFQFLPIGDILPLLLIALCYMLYILVKSCEFKREK